MKPNRTFTLVMAAWLADVACTTAQSTFTKITTGPIVTDQGQSIKGAWGDSHNSGYLDLVVCSL